jgi:hypothetical protein
MHHVQSSQPYHPAGGGIGTQREPGSRFSLHPLKIREIREIRANKSFAL